MFPLHLSAPLEGGLFSLDPHGEKGVLVCAEFLVQVAADY
jgi:hypothetical protein